MCSELLLGVWRERNEKKKGKIVEEGYGFIIIIDSDIECDVFFLVVYGKFEEEDKRVEEINLGSEENFKLKF